MNYDEFRRDYEHQHPASVPTLEHEMHEYPTWVQWAVLVTFIAAAMVSGVHTVPTVWKGIETGAIITESVRAIVSLAALVMVEFAILLSAYLMIKGSWLAYAGMTVAAAAAIIANLYSVILAFQHGGDGGAVLVAVIMGVAAPLIALLMGKMYVDIHRADRVQDMKAKRAYREACIAWDKEIERAYKLSIKGGKLSALSALSTLDGQLDKSADGRTDGQNYSTGQGYSKRTDAKDIVRQHLTGHPEDITANVRELAARLNVGKSTVSDVQRQLKAVSEPSNGHSQNGHSGV